MPVRMLDPRPDRPECFGAHAAMALRSAPPSQNSSSRGRPICEWKQTADGRVTSAWTLSEAHPAWLPEPSSEDGLPNTPPREKCLQALTGGTALIGRVYFPIWIRHCARPARTILVLAAAAGLFGLVASDWPRSTAAHRRDRVRTPRVSAVAPPATTDIVQSSVIDIPPSAPF